MNRLQMWLMNRYCPGFLFNCPPKSPSNIDKMYAASAYMIHGYWGQKKTLIYSKNVKGAKNAYIMARWLALKADFKYPSFFFDCGIVWEVREIK